MRKKSNLEAAPGRESNYAFRSNTDSMHKRLKYLERNVGLPTPCPYYMSTLYVHVSSRGPWAFRPVPYQKLCPAVWSSEIGIVVELPQVGGLHHRYERRAA